MMVAMMTVIQTVMRMKMTLCNSYKICYLKKMAKRTVMVLPVIFLSMAVLLTVFFVCLSAISENSKIHIGVVVPEKGFMERGLLEYVSNMADTKALCVFRELSETEAKEQLDEGKVAAYVTRRKIYWRKYIGTKKPPSI